VSRNPREAAIVSFGAGVFADQRFFDPYVGRDVGNARPFGLRMVSFFAVLHMRLLLGYTGFLMNGVGGVPLCRALFDRNGDLVAGKTALAQEPDRTLQCQSEGAQLGSPQRRGLLDVRDRFNVGDDGRRFGLSNAVR
jgi:hypothetical protein